MRRLRRAKPGNRQMKFVGRGEDGRLYWESRTTLPNDSRSVQYSCYADWFYAQMVRQQPEPAERPEPAEEVPC